MKITFAYILFTCLMCINIFAQFTDRHHKLKNKEIHDLRFNPHEQLREGNENTAYKIKVGDKEIPLNTQNGQSLNEKQLTVVRNVLTDDFLVNDDTTGGASQSYPTIALDGSGNFVIAWYDERNGNYDIYYQRYNSNGEGQGINTKANDDNGSAYQLYPTIAMDGSGNFVIAWYDERNGNYDIYYQRYNSNGEAQGLNTKVNDAGSGYLYSPTIAMDGTGNFVIAWYDSRNDNYDIYYQRYNSNGEAQGINTQANDDAGSADQWYPTIAMDGSGNFVIAWEDDRNSHYSDIYYQRYNSNGEAQGINTQANDAGSGYLYFPTIAMDGTGNFVIAWSDSRNDNYDIYYQRYNSNGEAQGINTQANDDAGSADQWYPTIAMDGSGNFVIAWYDERNGNSDIYYQRYNSNGEAQGINTKVDGAGSASQYSPTITMDGSGNFVIAWEDYRNSPYSDIYYQRYNSNGEAQGINTKANDDAGSASQYSPTIAMDGSGNFVIAWMDYRNYNIPDIYYQRYNSNGEAQGINTKANDDAGLADQWSPTIVMDGSGNFVIAWSDERNGNWDIYYQRYNSNGESQSINTKANDDAGSASQYSPTIAMDGSGNFVITWRDHRNGNYDYDIYYQRYNSNGESKSINTKANDDAGSASQYSPTIAMDGSGNFVIAWEDYRNYNISDIYYQRYNSNGEAQGINTKANDDAGLADQWSPTIVMDGSGNFVIAWSDERNGNWDIYYQRYNSNGESQGINTKTNDDAGSADQYSPTIVMNGAGNFVIAWEDYRFGLFNPEIIGQRYYANGTPNESNYRIVADGPNYGETLPVVAVNNNQIVFSWMDNRRSKGWDIYGKVVGWDWNGVTSVSEQGNNLPKEYVLEQNYPNPFNPTTKIKYTIPTVTLRQAQGDILVSLKIFDVLGNEITTLVNESQQPGTYEVEFNAGQTIILSSGVYYYQLRTGGFTQTKKMLLLK